MYSSVSVSGDDPEEVAAMQRRVQPPENEVPGAVRWRGLLARTDDLAVAVIGASAYSTGLTLHVAVRRRLGGRYPDAMDEEFFGHRPPGRGMLLGVGYPDGRAVSNLGGRFPEPGTPADRPCLVENGGGGGGRAFDQSYWLSPFPPPGDLTIVLAWPTRGIEETQASVPAAALAEARDAVVELWPWEPWPDEPLPEPPPPTLPPGGWFAEHQG